ncbi:hypothetical protein PMAYCL1PPCAC_15998 [Pristionchus mayeri]|uniref:Uncharacterized protein n=1 Tax=Pristionchus mayeri TaxID=1317129 RepID=A0AAN5CK28_9BILA|nr:hypothetical protein PMAYCL1PPCAC_15998 [Pristionchus mayeri]
MRSSSPQSEIVWSNRPTCREHHTGLLAYLPSAHRSSLFTFSDHTEVTFCSGAATVTPMKYTRYRILEQKAQTILRPEWALIRMRYSGSGHVIFSRCLTTRPFERIWEMNSPLHEYRPLALMPCDQDETVCICAFMLHFETNAIWSCKF